MELFTFSDLDSKEHAENLIGYAPVQSWFKKRL